MELGLSLREQFRHVVGPSLSGSENAKVLLLSCIDIRYPHRIIDAMDAEGYRGRYYHLAMAGGSHAARHDSIWTKAIHDHLDFALTHGNVTGVIILDHLDCKAFQLYEGTTPGDLAGERLKHLEVASIVVDGIVKKFSKLSGHVHALLLPVEPDPIRPEILAAG